MYDNSMPIPLFHADNAAALNTVHMDSPMSYNQDSNTLPYQLHTSAGENREARPAHRASDIPLPNEYQHETTRTSHPDSLHHATPGSPECRSTPCISRATLEREWCCEEDKLRLSLRHAEEKGEILKGILAESRASKQRHRDGHHRSTVPGLVSGSGHGEPRRQKGGDGETIIGKIRNPAGCSGKQLVQWHQRSRPCRRL